MMMCMQKYFQAAVASSLLLTISSSMMAADVAPIVRWDFNAEETLPLRSHGSVHRDVPGPRPPEYPDFEANNTAVKLDGAGAYFAYDDPGAGSDYDFGVGDAITLEAWVQVDELRKNENVYVVGKGRTGQAGFAPDNQNWAMRLRESQSKAGVSFLFATPLTSGTQKSDGHWHRWTTTSGFKPGKLWHHIAVSYRFGEPESVRCWIDGKPEKGKWDMGGATSEAPVVDDDAIWIGSSRGGAAGNSFRGSIDAIAIHRRVLDDATMKLRFRSTATEVVAKPQPEIMPELSDLPKKKVLLTLHEGMPAHTRWLNEGETFPRETMRFESDYFLLDRLPQRFDDWGIRESWKEPVLIRFSADVDLNPGMHRFMMRVRGLSRLWVDGKLIAKSKPITGSPSGEEPMTPVAEPPSPGMRIAEHRQQEVLGEYETSQGGKSRVILEIVLGGKGFRTDPGETMVAVQSSDDGPFVLLQAMGLDRSPTFLTDEQTSIALKRLEASLDEFDTMNRHQYAANQATYWNDRHSYAQEVVANRNRTQPPNRDQHPIDAFLKSKMDLAIASAAQTPQSEAQHFHTQVLPILKTECMRCHGEKEQGGLRLDSRGAALKSGDSEVPAIVPGKSSESEIIRRLTAEDPDERMPPGVAALSNEKVNLLKDWIDAGANWPSPPITPDQVTASSVLNDEAFLRRLYYDTVGQPPTANEVRRFLSNNEKDKRLRVIDQLLNDSRWADRWMGYWQDVLAENPTLINSSLNTTGPFRWFLYDSLRDNKPFDRLVTELIMLRGSPYEGGSAGFGIAGDNDAPFAAKAQIVTSAFLGIELQCARCHDSPYHSTKQSDLYSLAAMLEQKAVKVPKTSRVPAAFFENQTRESLIKVTIKPDQAIDPEWPFATVTGASEKAIEDVCRDPKNSRERLAALITSPHNTRFAQVIANRVWRQYLGAGIVEPPHDWEGNAASHPELLEWLAQDFVASGYDFKHLARTILTSQVYQRAATGHNLTTSSDLRFFAAPDPRRQTAEQIVDTFIATSGRETDVEELTFDPDARRAASNRLTLGKPRRAWMFANLANERDRPSLNLPRAQGIADILIAFGWTGARQNPKTDREIAANVLQPGVVANSIASIQFVRAVHGSELAQVAVDATSPSQLVDELFLRYLSRLPLEAEKSPLVKALSTEFEKRIVPEEQRTPIAALAPLPRVTWSNHLRTEANEIALELEKRARNGLPSDPRLQTEWREVYEDVIWSIINTREFVWLP